MKRGSRRCARAVAPSRKSSVTIRELCANIFEHLERHLVEAVTLVDDPLGQADRERGVARHLARQLFGRGEMRAVGDDAIHQPDLFSVRRLDHSRRHDQFLRARIADRPRKPGGAADVGHQADAHFRHSEARADRCDSRIACERQLEAEAADEAVQRADDRLLDTLDPVQRRLRLRHEAPKALHVGTAALAALRAGVIGERGEVDAGRERLSLAVNDNRANFGPIDLIDRLGNRTEHRLVNRVALLGPIERDIRDFALDSNLDWIVRHD